MNSYVIVYSFTRERDDRGSYSVGVPPLLYQVSVLHSLRNHILILHLMDWPCGVHNRLHLGNCKNYFWLGQHAIPRLYSEIHSVLDVDYLHLRACFRSSVCFAVRSLSLLMSVSPMDKSLNIFISRRKNMGINDFSPD